MNYREVMQQALSALEIGHESAMAEAKRFKLTVAIHNPRRRAQIASAIAALRAALDNPEPNILYEDCNGAMRSRPEDCTRFECNGVPYAVWVNYVRYVKGKTE